MFPLLLRNSVWAYKWFIYSRWVVAFVDGSGNRITQVPSGIHIREVGWPFLSAKRYGSPFITNNFAEKLKSTLTAWHPPYPCTVVITDQVKSCFIRKKDRSQLTYCLWSLATVGSKVQDFWRCVYYVISSSYNLIYAFICSNFHNFAPFCQCFP